MPGSQSREEKHPILRMPFAPPAAVVVALIAKQQEGSNRSVSFTAASVAPNAESVPWRSLQANLMTKSNKEGIKEGKE